MPATPINPERPVAVSEGQGQGQGQGLVLVRGRARASARWLRRGLVAVAAVDLPGWTGICLTEATARTGAPYDVGLEVLAARPVPARRRPAIGLFVLDNCAVVTVQPRGWRADQRWLVWRPGAGVVRTEGLAPLPASLIAATAGTGVASERVVELFRSIEGSPVEVLCTLLALLALPGEELLRHGPTPTAREIVPSVGTLRRFEQIVSDDESGGTVAP